MTDFNSDTYFLAPAIQQSFINKADGTLLAGGKVYFYDDESKNTAQDVFYLTGNYPNYTVTAFPRDAMDRCVITLSSIGTVVDPLGNPCEIYYHPYDSEGKVSNYYIEVYSSDDVFQFSISNFPGIGQGSSDNDQAEENYIGNGQFLLHNNIIDPVNGNGTISQDDTAIAPGGHYFVRDSSAGKQIVTFSRESDNAQSDYPRYSAYFQQTGTGLGGTRKDYVFRFPDVNTFASDDQTYTFVFSAKSDGGNQDVDIFYYKYFGVGGDTLPPQTITTKTIDGSWTRYAIEVTFGSNEGKSIGDNDDDYVEIGIRFPVTSSYGIYVTDVLLSEGTNLGDEYPITTKQEDCWRALAGGHKFEDESGNPVYDGYQKGLPVIIGDKGYQPDFSVVGKIESWGRIPADITIYPVLKADGQGYRADSSSSLNIPYKRISNAFWDSTTKNHIYGTGYNFFTCNTNSADLLIMTNQVGTVTAPDPGTTSFTIDITHPATATNNDVRSYLTASTKFNIENMFAGEITNPPSNSGAGAASISIINSGTDSTSATSSVNLRAARQIIEVTAETGSNLTVGSGSPGKYFQFDAYNGGNKRFFVWYEVNGEIAPSVTGTAIKVKVGASDTAAVVALKTAYAVNGVDVSQFTCVAASSITAGQYFTINTVSTEYYVWYKKDNSGTDPAPSGKTGILVNILTADTASEVATKTLEAIHRFMVGMPDLRGVFIRGFDDGRGFDLDSSLRYSLLPNYRGDKIGTMQYDQVMKHGHLLDRAKITSDAEPWAGVGTRYYASPDQNYETVITKQTSATEGSESRPYNMSVLYVVRY